MDHSSGPDKDRGGALPISIGTIVTDELNPDGGDHTDWKSISVPTPGFLTVQVFWDQSADIHGAVITVHDRFGAELQKRAHQPHVPQDELVVRVEPGYYFVRLQAERGRSIYSIVARHQGAAGGDDIGGGSRPEFSSVIPINAQSDGESAGGGGAAAAGGGGGSAAAGGSDGGAAAAPVAALPAPAGGGAALPAAAGGGVALPGVAAGGAAAPAAAAPVAAAPVAAAPVAPVAVSAAPRGGGASGGQGKAAAAPAKRSITPIAADVSGPYREFEVSVSLMSELPSGTRLKFTAGESTGIKAGHVGEIYAQGKIIDGARFKVTRVAKNSSQAETNATRDDLRNADKYVVKIPE